MSNAAKFTENGSVILTAERHKNQAGDWIEIQVRDTGVGIAPDDFERLFRDFGQVKRDKSTKYQGTGLGLALSQKLCALMGGGISATSEVGAGSCFTIRVLAWMTEQSVPQHKSSELFSEPSVAPAY
jgi:signal transduction histidine kinase